MVNSHTLYLLSYWSFNKKKLICIIKLYVWREGFEPSTSGHEPAEIPAFSTSEVDNGI
jgi:hypothetical protein